MGDFCRGVGNFFYDPSNCDAGYWCGCRVRDKTKCIPKMESEYWVGHFTTNRTNTTAPVEIVIWSNAMGFEDATICKEGMYCPGKDDDALCPDSCPPGKVCKTPAKMEDCPSGGYCPVSSIVEIKCKGLQGCYDSGQRRFKPIITLVFYSFFDIVHSWTILFTKQN